PKIWGRCIRPLLEDPEAARRTQGWSVAELADRVGRTVKEIKRWEETEAPSDIEGRPLAPAHLRPTNVTTKILRGASVKIAGASVGHNDERTTERHYIGPLFGAFKEVADNMSDIFTSCDADASKPANEL